VNASHPEATLYGILGSHACKTGELLLEHKRIPYRRVDLPTVFHAGLIRLRGFPGSAPRRLGEHERRTWAVRIGDRLGTVPAVRYGQQRWQTNREIARRLDEVEPEPALYPADPEQRAEVEAAELWGDDVFQMVARRLVLAAVVHGPDALYDRARDGRLGTLLWHHDNVRFAGTRMLARFAWKANVDSERGLLDGLPPMLDRIDAWIDAGVLNGEELNAADFMLLTSLALLAYRRDLRDEIESRPGGELMDRVLPEPVEPG
jgi:glutathione S-transferase